ncbi:hypothetical protein BT96DRAFT_679864 [Gymnopus androsaceus JB14]|uniref:Uncharacterized protein n=1 Tax=Gymnopus androsaceus JB14 TaxID=1447944 RepID=A0A6A4HS06_9AGAR|nr:hypothetical protein BT96DRAFT_679864 [Gymnopus androsaceus JB14]
MFFRNLCLANGFLLCYLLYFANTLNNLLYFITYTADLVFYFKLKFAEDIR